MTTYTTKIAKNGSVRYYDAQTGKAIAKKTALENERNYIRTNGTTKERYEIAKETYRVDSNGKIEKFGWHQELRRDSSGFYHVEVRGWYNHCGTTDYDFANDMQKEFGLTIDEFKAEAEAQAEEKIEETATEEIVEVEANTEVKAEETKSGIGDIFKAAVKTLGEEVSESDAKFEIGKTYFVMHFLTHQTDTITVEARTAQMLTGTTNEGTRKFRIFENVRGEFVKVGKDEEDGNDIYIYAKNEFTPANVEAGKKAAIETAAKLGINTEPQAETELPEGFIEVTTGADAFKKVAPYFPDGATFKAVSKGFNREDFFTFEGKNGIFLRVACTPDNKRVECVEVVNANESGSKRTPLLVAIKPIIPEPEKFTATQITFPNGYEGEPTVEVSQTFDNLDDAARFIANEYPIIADEHGNLHTAYDGYCFNGVYFAGWRITRGGKTLCEVDCLGNTHGDEDIDSLVCKYFDENDKFIIPDAPGFLAPEAQDDYKEFRPKLEIVTATFNHTEVLDVKEILAPLADQAEVELGNITISNTDDKTCTVNIEVKGSTNAIEKFKALLGGRHPEPPTNSKKFIKAALDTEPERNQQVVTARKEVVASSAEAIGLTRLDTLKEKRTILRRAFFEALKNHFVEHNGEYFDAAESGYSTCGFRDHTLYRKDGDKFVEVDDKTFDALNRLEIKMDFAEDAVNAEIAKTQFKFEAGKYYVNDEGNKFFCIKRNKKSVKFFDCAFTQDDGFMDLDADEDDDWERKVFKCKIQFDERGEFVDWYEGDPDDDGDRDLITILAKNVTDPPEPEHDPEDEDEDDKPDGFTAELAKLKSEQSAAKNHLDEKEAELIKAQDAHQAAKDNWNKTNRAIDNLYRAKAEELSDKLLPLRKSVLEVKTQDGFQPYIALDTVTISLDKGKFAIHGDCDEKLFFELARYDTPAQVEAAINGLKATDALGGDKFTFPANEELNASTADKFKSAVKTEIKAAQKIVRTKRAELILARVNGESTEQAQHELDLAYLRLRGLENLIVNSEEVTA